MVTKPEYSIRLEKKRLFDILLFFQHRKIDKMLKELAEKYDDPARKIIEFGTGTKAKEHKRLFSEAHFIASDIRKYPDIDKIVDVTQSNALPSEYYDLAICMNVLEHISEPQMAVNVMYQCLKSGGELFIVTPFLFPVHDPPYDFYRYSEYSLQKLLNSFSKVSIKKVHCFIKMGLFDRMVLYYVVEAIK